MRKVVRFLVLIPIFIIVVVFAIANRTPVNLSINPFTLENPSFAIIDVPLFIVLFATLFVGITLGGIFTWLNLRKKHQHVKNSKSYNNNTEIDPQKF